MRRSCLVLLAIVGVLVGCSSGASDDGSTSRPGTEKSESTQHTAAERADYLQFRPVLTVTMCPDGIPRTTSPTTGADTVPSRRTCASCIAPVGRTVAVASSDGTLCYQLGPIGADGGDLGSARAELGANGEWGVIVRAADRSIARVNRVLNACANSEPTTCPGSGQNPGAVAIVIDGQVVSAPVVQAQNIADDEFQISGAFSEREARELAARLS